MSLVHLGCIVEGQSEQQSLPVLVRRIAAGLSPELAVNIPKPVRKPRSGIEYSLEAAIQQALNRLPSPRGILIVLDADDECPAEVGVRLLAQARELRSDLPIELVLAKYEFENWFLAAAESIRGKCQLSDELSAPAEPETIRDAKGWLSKQKPRNRKYEGTVDQARLTAQFDLDLARQRSRSFAKCFDKITRLLAQIIPPQPPATEESPTD